MGILYGGEKMINVGEWNWIVDTNEMTCRNVENEVTIKMQKDGEKLKGTLHDMPIDLFAKIAQYGNGERIIEKIVRMAEEEYFRAHLSG